VDAATDLLVPPLESEDFPEAPYAPAAGPSAASPLAETPGGFEPEADWWIQVVATAGAARDRLTYAGVRPDASPAWDRSDIVEPPPLGEYVRVYFPNRDWSVRPDEYAVDVRPAERDGVSWDL
jgi:hypothetical protein